MQGFHVLLQAIGPEKFTHQEIFAGLFACAVCIFEL